eukprot:5278560-Pyramimonas_sp.AAC.1
MRRAREFPPPSVCVFRALRTPRRLFLARALSSSVRCIHPLRFLLRLAPLVPSALPLPCALLAELVPRALRSALVRRNVCLRLHEFTTFSATDLEFVSYVLLPPL